MLSLVLRTGVLVTELSQVGPALLECEWVWVLGPLVGRGRGWVSLVWLVTYLVDNGMQLGGRVLCLEEFRMCLGWRG